MTTAAVTVPRRPFAVWVLIVGLVATAAVTVVVDLLNWRYAPNRGFGLAVLTVWALLRVFGFLLLAWHVSRGKAAARPLGLILAVTTVFAVGRILVPRQGVPPLPGILGFAVLTLLCLAVLWLLYRCPPVIGYLTRHPGRLVISRQGIAWRRCPPRRPPVNGWLLTARVAAFTYTPLMLVPCLVATGTIIDGRLTAVPAVLFWFGFALATGYTVLFGAFFLLRHRRWAGALLAVVTVGVLAVDLPLCWWLLGLDGLVRDGAPLVTAGGLALYGLWRGSRSVATGGDVP